MSILFAATYPGAGDRADPRLGVGPVVPGPRISVRAGGAGNVRRAPRDRRAPMGAGRDHRLVSAQPGPLGPLTPAARAVRADGGNPSAFLRLTQMIRDIDVRAVLPAIHVPTLVIQRLGDRITPRCHGRYLASHIAGARYFEQPGDHSLRFAASGDNDALCAEIADFLATTLASGRSRSGAGHDPARQPDRGRGAGDRGRTATAEPEDLVRAHRGRLIKSGARRPARHVRRARAGDPLRAAVLTDAAAAGIQIRAGIHTGEVDLVGEDIAGASVQITDRVAALAGPRRSWSRGRSRIWWPDRASPSPSAAATC